MQRNCLVKTLTEQQCLVESLNSALCDSIEKKIEKAIMVLY